MTNGGASQARRIRPGRERRREQETQRQPLERPGSGTPETSNPKAVVGDAAGAVPALAQRLGEARRAPGRRAGRRGSAAIWRKHGRSGRSAAVVRRRVLRPERVIDSRAPAARGSSRSMGRSRGARSAAARCAAQASIANRKDQVARACSVVRVLFQSQRLPVLRENRFTLESLAIFCRARIGWWFGS